uniref:Nucleoside deoxyribosyltransferase n=1 Tax=viral metagenome TaxID=1070528 RepID=A0A6M3JKJ2_9ZZZZ
MKIALFGTTSYQGKMLRHEESLKEQGHEVKLPAFDSHPEFDDIEVCEFNRSLIEWAERIDVFWDNRSVGFVFDFGMIFMARKPIHVAYLEPKTLAGVLTKYEGRMI